MKRSMILLVDAVINVVLGLLLILYTPGIVRLLGVPFVEQAFYARILGGVLFGIGIALVMECHRKEGGLVGLGLGGAVSINLCGGFILGFLLIRGRLLIPVHGRLFLWGLVAILVCISGLELMLHLSRRKSIPGHVDAR